MAYTVKDYNHEPGFVSYINEDSDSPENGWTTTVPMRHTKFVEEPTPPKIFMTKTEAKEYLDAIRSGRLEDWEKNGWYYKAHGRRKPHWKIYPATPGTVTS